MGIASLLSPNEAGANSVTLGSSPRNAERRNLNPPIETNRSVHARMASLRSLWGSECSTLLPALPPNRFIRATGLIFATMQLQAQQR